MTLFPKTIAAVVAATAALSLTGTSAEAASFSNAFYEVHVQSTPAFGTPSGGPQYGSWNAVTGPSHPTGPNNHILYNVMLEDGTTTNTNFSSLRIFDPTGTTRDYAFGGRGDRSLGGRGNVNNLDNFWTSESATSVFGSNGFQTTWNLAPENLEIVQDLVAVGTTYDNSAIYHTVELTNTGDSAISLGWRNLYDWTVNDPSFDDGPNNQIEVAGGGGVVVPATTNEFSYTPTPGSFARVSVDPGVATYQPLLGLGFDPGLIAALPTTTPDLYNFASWRDSSVTAYDYTINPALNITYQSSDPDDRGGDSAGLSYFTATLAPGESTRFTQVIFAAVPNGSIPGDTTSVPEPSSVLSVLAFGALGAASQLKRKQQRKV
jgi:hypothetical protein